MIDVVAIDGPVGVGKSAVASLLARRLGWQHLDTGAMYRAVALLALRGGTALDDEAGCARIARSMRFRFETAENGQRVFLDGEDVSEAIRSGETTEAVSVIAVLREVREEMVRRQRELGASVPSVAEGRDMTTVVFPQARWKFYLDADPRVRLQRRGDQLQEQGQRVNAEQLSESITARDLRDREREVGALRIAQDAIVFDTTNIDLPRVVAILDQLVRAERP